MTAWLLYAGALAICVLAWRQFFRQINKKNKKK